MGLPSWPVWCAGDRSTDQRAQIGWFEPSLCPKQQLLQHGEPHTPQGFTIRAGYRTSQAAKKAAHQS